MHQNGRCFSISDVAISSISKPGHCTERPSLVLLSAYQEYLMPFKWPTLQLLQRERSLITRICGAQRVKENGLAKPKSRAPYCTKLTLRGKRICFTWIRNCLNIINSQHIVVQFVVSNYLFQLKTEQGLKRYLGRTRQLARV